MQAHRAHAVKPALVQSAAFSQTQTLFTHLPNPLHEASSEQPPPPAERQYFLPMSSEPEQVVPTVVQSLFSMHVSPQRCCPESTRQSWLEPTAPQSVWVLHCGLWQAPWMHVGLLGYMSVGQVDP